MHNLGYNMFKRNQCQVGKREHGTWQWYTGLSKQSVGHKMDWFRCDTDPRDTNDDLGITLPTSFARNCRLQFITWIIRGWQNPHTIPREVQGIWARPNVLVFHIFETGERHFSGLILFRRLEDALQRKRERERWRRMIYSSTLLPFKVSFSSTEGFVAYVLSRDCVGMVRGQVP